MRRAASRSADRRALQKTIVERWARISSSSRGCIAGQMLRRTGPAAAGPLTGSSITSPSAPMSSTGTTISTSSGLRTPALTIVTGRGPLAVLPPRNRAISSSGRWVADSPMRWNGRSRDLLEPLERQREVRTPLGRRDRVDLVDDHRFDAA